MVRCMALRDTCSMDTARKIGTNEELGARADRNQVAAHLAGPEGGAAGPGCLAAGETWPASPGRASPARLVRLRRGDRTRASSASAAAWRGRRPRTRPVLAWFRR